MTSVPTMPEIPADLPAGDGSAKPELGIWTLWIVLFGIWAGIVGWLIYMKTNRRKANRIATWSAIWSSICLVAVLLFVAVALGSATRHKSADPAKSSSAFVNTTPSGATGNGGGPNGLSNPDGLDYGAASHADAKLVTANPTAWLTSWFGQLEQAYATHETSVLAKIYLVGSTSYTNEVNAVNQFAVGSTPVPFTNVTATVDQHNLPAVVLDFSVELGSQQKTGLVTLTVQNGSWVVNKLSYNGQ